MRFRLGKRTLGRLGFFSPAWEKKKTMKKQSIPTSSHYLLQQQMHPLAWRATGTYKVQSRCLEAYAVLPLVITPTVMKIPPNWPPQDEAPPITLWKFNTILGIKISSPQMAAPL